MSHPEQLGFMRLVAAGNQALVAGARLIEIGSYDVNGSVRQIFAGVADYVGVDLVAGPGVDRIGFGHEVDDPDGSFDLAVSAECLEHDPHWRETFATMCRVTRPGGLVAITCASSGRPEHGTRRTDADASPGTQSIELDYYGNLRAADLDGAVDLEATFAAHAFWFNPTSRDLYFAGVRAGEAPRPPVGRLPDGDDVRHLEHLMPWRQRVIRWPLRAGARLLPEERYQRVIRPYWRGVKHLAGSRQRHRRH